MKKNFYTRSTCRLCNSSSLKMIYKFPDCPPVDNYRFEQDPEINYPSFPMDLYQCSDCGHAQLLDVVDPKILFGSYIYTSSSSPDLDIHFDSYAQKVLDYVKLSPDDLIIDIGSNDGLFLSKFKNRGYKVLGIDASEYAARIATTQNSIPTVVSFLDLKLAKTVVESHGFAKVVTANNVFSHSDDLRGFAEAAKALLSPEGVFIFEVSYLMDLVRKKVVDYVYHEHLAHHSIKPFKQFFESLGMKLIDVELVPTKGGSIRCYAAHANSSWEINQSVARCIENEISAGLYDSNTYQSLKLNIDKIGSEVGDILSKIIKDGGTIASYGASATSTVLNYLFDINKYFSFVVDDNASRQGRLSPGVRLVVKSKDALLAENPTAVFISAWRFADMIIERNAAYIDQGGIFIVPLPEIRVVKK